MTKLQYLQDKNLEPIFKFLHRINIFCMRSARLLVFCIVGICSYQFVQAQQDFRCAVRLTFDSDNTGSVANYVLSLQLKNTKGRNINGASILYKDSQGQVLGNTFLECLKDPEGIKPGSYGVAK